VTGDDGADGRAECGTLGGTADRTAGVRAQSLLRRWCIRINAALRGRPAPALGGIDVLLLLGLPLLRIDERLLRARGRCRHRER
jgi:hypothetical protein